MDNKKNQETAQARSAAEMTKGNEFAEQAETTDSHNFATTDVIMGVCNHIVFHGVIPAISAESSTGKISGAAGDQSGAGPESIPMALSANRHF